MIAEPSESDPTPEQDLFRVLFLCTGNSCRSPIAAGLFKNMVEGLPIEVMSAGTMERPPSPATPEAIQVAADLGADLSSHRSRSLSSIAPDDVDLLIGFERQHVAIAVVEAGFPSERCFMLAELAALALSQRPPVKEQTAQQARTIVSDLGAEREGLIFSADLEIADPIGQPVRFYESTAIRIRELCEPLASNLFGGVSSSRADADRTDDKLPRS